MTHKNKATQQGSPSSNKTQSELNHSPAFSTRTKPATQKERVLLALLYEKSLNSQEAEKHPIKARHLNSVVSELKHRDNLDIQRDRDIATGYNGEICYLIRYSVYWDSQAEAKQLVDLWRAKRRAPPIDWVRLRSTPLEKLIRSS